MISFTSRLDLVYFISIYILYYLGDMDASIRWRGTPERLLILVDCRFQLVISRKSRIIVVLTRSNLLTYFVF